MNYGNFEIIRSGRKTLCIQIRSDKSIVIRAPYSAKKCDIEEFVSKHEGWIKKHMQCTDTDDIVPFTDDEKSVLYKKAESYFKPKCDLYADIVGVSYGKITVRMQKTRWGSCSANGNLSFNCLLMLLPERVIDSVIVHELCHRKHMNHSGEFYREVLRVFPDYFKCRSVLKSRGCEIMRKAGF